MRAVMQRLTELSDDGASAVEYSLLVAAIAAIIVLVVAALGTNVFGLFSHTCNSLSAASSVSC